MNSKHRDNNLNKKVRTKQEIWLKLSTIYNSEKTDNTSFSVISLFE